MSTTKVIVPSAIFDKAYNANSWDETWNILFDAGYRGSPMRGGLDHVDYGRNKIRFFDRGVNRNGRIEVLNTEFIREKRGVSGIISDANKSL